MKCTLLVLSMCAYLASCLPPHPDVVAVKREEEIIVSPHQRSPALHNPHLREVLPLTSSLHHGEKLVFERETNKVPRKEVYKILTHAGLISRKSKQHQGHQSADIHYEEHILNFPSFFPSHDYLQYL